MGATRGPSAGVVSGILSLQAGQQYTGRVYQWSRSYKIPEKDRSGRGGPRFAQTRRLNAGSTISFRIQGTGVSYPAPIGIYNSLGTVVLQYDTGKTVTLVGEITRYEESFAQPKNKDGPETGENWDVGVVMELSQDPTYAGWPGTQATPATQTFLDQETDVGLYKTVDPNNLQNAAGRAWDVGTIADTNAAETAKALHFAGSAAPFNTLKAVTATLRRTDRAGVVVHTTYAQTDTADRVKFPRTSSRRDFSEAFTDNIGEIVDAVGTVAEQNNTLAATFQGVAYAKAVNLYPLTDGKRLAVYEFRNIGYLVRGTTKSGARSIKAKMTAGKAQLFVQNYYTYTTGRNLIILSMQDDYSANIRDFVLFRQIIGTTIPENSASTINGIALPNIGQINTASFLGLAAKTVVYQGVRFKVNLGLTAAGNLSMLIGYSFHATSLGIINGVPTGIYGRRLPQETTITWTVPGYYDADALGFPGITQPTDASFAAFNSLP